MRAFKQKSALLISFCFLLNGSSASAYFYPGGYGNAVPGLLSFLPYYGFSFLNRGPYSAYPMFTLQNSLYRASTRALASPYNYTGYALQNPSNYPYGTEQYVDPEPYYQPRQRTRPARMGLSGVDQNIHAGWQQSVPNNNLTAQAPPQNSFNDPFLVSQAPQAPLDPRFTSQPNSGPFTAPGEMPPLAPQVVTKKSQRKTPMLYGHETESNATAGPLAPGPLAQGFVAKVNELYDGDISRALFDPNMRGWARCLDLVQDDDIIKLELSTARVALIQQVLKDQTLDDLSKLDAVKVLLRGSAKRASE